MYFIFDLDQTLVDSRIAEPFRKSRNWEKVYELVSSIKPYENINEVLITLKEKSHKIAIVTSSPDSYCKKIIIQNKWDFDAVVCYHDTKLKKPDEEPILLAMKKLGVETNKNDNVYSFGDRDIDIIASNNAGIISVACLWGCEDKETILKANPKIVLNNVNEIILKLLV